MFLGAERVGAGAELIGSHSHAAAGGDVADVGPVINDDFTKCKPSSSTGIWFCVINYSLITLIVYCS